MEKGEALFRHSSSQFVLGRSVRGPLVEKPLKLSDQASSRMCYWTNTDDHNSLCRWRLFFDFLNFWLVLEA